MSKKKALDEKQTYKVVGFTFVAAGAIFLLNETSRALSFTFIILGITFLILASNNKTK